MAIIFNGTKITQPVFNNTLLTEVYFNNVLVWPTSGSLFAWHDYSTHILHLSAVQLDSNYQDVSDYLDGKGYVNTQWGTYTSDYTKVVFDNEVKPRSTSYWFDASDVTEVDWTNCNFSECTSWQYMFGDCYGLTQITFPSGLDTSKLQSMEKLFVMCSNLTSVDMSNLDTSAVTNVSYLFDRCENITSINFGSIDLSNVTHADGTFRNCKLMTSLPIGNFGSCKLESAWGMFDSCEKVTSLSVSSFNTTNLTSCGSMFSSCIALTTLDLDSWDMNHWFEGDYMFTSCTGLKTLYIRNFYPQFSSSHELSTGYSMFTGNTSLQRIYCDYNWVNTIEDAGLGMFENMSSNLVGGGGLVWDHSHVNNHHLAWPGGYFTERT